MSLHTQDLDRHIHQNKNLTLKDSQEVVRMVFAFIKDSIMKEGSININEFGTFSVSTMKQRSSIIVYSGERVTYPECKIIRFKPSPKAKKQINTNNSRGVMS